MTDLVTNIISFLWNDSLICLFIHGCLKGTEKSTYQLNLKKLFVTTFYTLVRSYVSHILEQPEIQKHATLHA